MNKGSEDEDEGSGKDATPRPTGRVQSASETSHPHSRQLKTFSPNVQEKCCGLFSPSMENQS